MVGRREGNKDSTKAQLMEVNYGHPTLRDEEKMIMMITMMTWGLVASMEGVI